MDGAKDVYKDIINTERAGDSGEELIKSSPERPIKLLTDRR